jgi:hypothetical protein
MIRPSLLDFMATQELATMIPDPHAINVQTGSSLQD